MITFRELGNRGAIGNQMFEYASLRGIAARANQGWKIPRPGTSSNYYNLFDFFKMESVTEDNFIRNEVYPSVRIKKLVFDSSLFSIKGNFDLDDYLASWKYFDHIKDLIIQDFEFKDIIIDIPKEPYIFLHVRRTDYLKTTVSQRIPPLPLNYYTKALEYFPTDIQVRIFSDDLDWCKDNFKADRFIINSSNDYYEEPLQLKSTGEYVQYAHPLKDFQYMVNAVGAIIANSTFSWWGAYLIKDKQYPIVCPNPWFKDVPHNFNDLVLPDWKVVEWRQQ